MICLSCDIHHMSLKTGNQQHADRPETEIAMRFLEMLEKKGVKATFFITGKCFAEEWHRIKPMCSHPLIEIGGHTYFCFEPAIIYRVSKKLVGSYNGPRWLQWNDISRTLRIIEEKTGKQIKVWRNHMYMHGPYTEELLAKGGIQICSDNVQRSNTGLVAHPSGIYNFPLNIIPDHEHLYHAERTREWVDQWIRRYNWSDDYGSQSYDVAEWTNIVLNGLKIREKCGIISNMIIHPITLYLCDRLVSFNRILDFLSEHETVTMSEVLKLGILHKERFDDEQNLSESAE